MTENEGRGFMLRAATDGPWAGWAGSRFLEEGLASVHAAPGRALARLMNLAALLPGGFGLIWDHPPAWMEALPAESRQGWWEAISAIPGLTLHLGPDAAAQLPGGAFRAWLHAPEMPEGPLGEAWRQGVVGWVPRTGAAWHLPDLGTPAPGDEVPPGWLWGEVTLPIGALSTLASGEALAAAMSEAQGAAERGLAQRMSANAWVDLPFLRRAAGWRLALVGGIEFQRAGGAWPAAFGQLRALKALLQERLRTPIHLGACGDPRIAALLGRQALREGLPWRASLPLPPPPAPSRPALPRTRGIPHRWRPAPSSLRPGPTPWIIPRPSSSGCPRCLPRPGPWPCWPRSSPPRPSAGCRRTCRRHRPSIPIVPGSRPRPSPSRRTPAMACSGVVRWTSSEPG